MKKHPYYDMWMHDDAELSSLFGTNILQRQTIHEWPISSIQKLTLEDGRTIIYKCASKGTVESVFYDRVSSPILPKARTLWRDNGYSCIEVKYFDTPPIGQSNLPESEVLQMGDTLLELIRRIRVDFPVLLDIGTYPKWTDMAGETISSLRKLVEDGRQYGLDTEDIDYMEEKVISPAIKEVFDGQTGLVHGDLNGGNIFLRDDGYKLIDWQSCKLAPIELDRADFLSEQGIDLSKYIRPEVAYMLHFMLIWWFVQCQTTLITEINYDKWIAESITSFMKVDGRLG